MRKLVALGVFAHELDHSVAAPVAAERLAHADIAVVFASGTAEETSIARSYSRRAMASVLVLPSALETGGSAWECDETAISPSGAEPVSREALQRVARLARRRAEGTQGDGGSASAVVFGKLVFRPGQPWLQAGNADIAGLSPTEFGVLRALVSAQGAIVPKSVLQLELTGGDQAASDGYLKTVVLRIRRKVERLGGDASQLAAIRGSGYVLKA